MYDDVVRNFPKDVEIGRGKMGRKGLFVPSTPYYYYYVTLLICPVLGREKARFSEAFFVAALVLREGRLPLMRIHVQSGPKRSALLQGPMCFPSRSVCMWIGRKKGPYVCHQKGE